MHILSKMKIEENQPAHAEGKALSKSHPKQPEDAPAVAGTLCSNAD